MTGPEFVNWLEDHHIYASQLAAVLGVSSRGAYQWRKRGTPFYVDHALNWVVYHTSALGGPICPCARLENRK